MLKYQQHYVPDPYATIIQRLGNAYGQGFFMNGACLCLASILMEASEEAGHPASLKLILEDGLFLHHALVEITIDGRTYSLDIQGPSAEQRYLSGFSDTGLPINTETARNRQPTESHEYYLVSLIKQYGTDYHLEDFAGGKDPSKSYKMVRKIGMDLIEH